MIIFKTIILCILLYVIHGNPSEKLSINTCAEPTDKAISLIRGFMVREKLSEYRSDLGLENVLIEDIQPLAALLDSEEVCDALNTKFAHFLVAEDDLYSYASYFIVANKYVAVFTPLLPDDVSDEEVMVTGLSFLYVLDDELNQIGGSAGF